MSVGGAKILRHCCEGYSRNKALTGYWQQKDSALAEKVRGLQGLVTATKRSLLLCACLAALTSPARAEQPLAAGELPGALPTIGTISITNNDIFDLDKPDENRALYRLANRLHVRTRPDVIRQQLLFDIGDSYSRQAIEESERILRSNRYIQEVSLHPVPREDGTVDIDVTTSDVWTLMPQLSFSKAGGENKTAIGIKEMNVLGTGIAVEAMFKSDVDRDSTILKVVDRNLGQSWYRLATSISQNSDGHEYGLDIGKPFYSLSSTEALGLSLLDADRLETFYDRGEVASDVRHLGRDAEIMFGRSRGLANGWARRLTFGAAVSDHSYLDSGFTNPELFPLMQDRRLVYPFIGWEIVEDRYDKARNLDQIHRIEDRFLGTRASARIGLAREEFGSDRNAWMLDLHAQRGFGGSERSTLLLAADANTRLESDGPQNLLFEVSAKYYKRQSDRRLLFVGLSGTYGHNPDLDQYLPLGGDNGLRGYPVRFQYGDKRAMLSVEQRLYTEWHPFSLFRVGAAAFFDVGRTWGASPLSDPSDTLLSDVGFGLRIGSTRSGLGRMIHFDVAFPLSGQDNIDNIQFLVSTRKGF
jgi:hypothetical protein